MPSSTVAQPQPTTPTPRPRPARAAEGSGALPATGVVLAGSPRHIAGLAAGLGGLSRPPIVAGWIDLETNPSPADSAPEGAARLGSLTDLPLLTARLGLRCLVACLPSSDTVAVSRVRAAAAKAGLELRILPTLEDLLATTPAVTAEPDPAEPHSPTVFHAAPVIDLGALIGRKPHTLDRKAVGEALTGKRVLITGAGGSIGSELARVAADFQPEQIILMERAENALFEIDRQIARRFPLIARKAVLHDVVDEESTLRLLRDLRPQVVFHAAAHKHVPLMEDHPGHAITNNLFGTKSIADAAVAVGAERFVMISSDKAVNPTSVMGATKRMAEMYVRGLGARSGATRLSMVRFGNVLGSACSVLTIWSTQIAEALSAGGRNPPPLTITDPRMTRYFMTIPEAATLVVQSMVVRAAGKAGAEGGVGVYVLDMGDPIRILDLAARFIRAHGAWPRFRGGPDLADAGINPEYRFESAAPPGCPVVDVVITGARPGEKIHEELAYAAEMLAPTDHPGIRSWAGPGFGVADAARVQAMVAEVSEARFGPDRGSIVGAIRSHVPEMLAVQ